MVAGAVIADDAPALSRREQIERLEREMVGLLPAPHRVTHTFGPGFYVRTAHLEAGCVYTGMVHKTEHMIFVSEGTLTLINDDGEDLVRAGFQAVSRAGVKRAVYCHTDAVVSNVHITNETDLVKLEAMLVEPVRIAREVLPCLG